MPGGEEDMKAITVPQPFTFEILSGRKTIEAMDWESLYRGDLLICASKKPAFADEDIEEMEEEYGIDFLLGQALCVARLVDVRLMQEGDEDLALLDEIDPEAYSWVFTDVRPVLPFPVKDQEGVFDVDDALITLSPYVYGDPVAVGQGVRDQDFGMDFSGWHGRALDIVLTGEKEPRVRIEWDSITMGAIPVDIIARCEKEGFDWTGVLLRFGEIERAEARDTLEDVQDAIDRIVDGNPAIFGYE